MANSLIEEGRAIVPRAENLVGKRIILTIPPAEEEIIIHVVPDKEVKPEEGKIAVTAPLVKFLQEKEVNGEYDFLTKRGFDTLSIRYKIIRIE